VADGGWVVLGAVVGASGSLITTWLNSWLRGNRLSAYDKAAISILKKKLQLGGKLKPLVSLANVIGAEEEATKRLLLLLGARAAEGNPQLWGLISRNPLRGESKVADET
jgi:hypothetical protein